MIRAFLICFACCCSSFMPLKQSESIVNDEQSFVIEKKVKNNYYRTDSGYYRFSATDLMSLDFFESALDFFVVDMEQTWLSYSVDQIGQYSYRLTTPCGLSGYDYNGDKTYHNVTDVSYVVVNKYQWGNDYGGLRTYYYSIMYSNHAPYDNTVSFNFTIQEDFNMRGRRLVGVNCIISQALQNLGTGWSDINEFLATFAINENANGNNPFFYPLVIQSHTDDYNSGYSAGYNNGVSVGYDSVVNNPDSTGYQSIYTTGYQNGYTNGYTEALDTDSTALTIFTGFVNVGLLPVNVLLQMFNYEVFGINIAGLLSSIITIAIVVIIIRVVTGKKND